MENYINRYVVFESCRFGYEGTALGKIIECAGREILIQRIDIPKDSPVYSRELGANNVRVLDANDEFLARLEF